MDASVTEPSRSMNIRWRVLLPMWIAQTLVAWLLPMVLLGAWEEPLDYLTEREPILLALIVGAALAAMQSIFLFPVRKPGLKRTGRSVWLTMGVAGFAGAALVTALCAAAAEVYTTILNGPEIVDWDTMRWTIIVIQGLGWALATPLLVAFTKQERRETSLGRVASYLFTGSIVEVVAVVPLDVMVRRKHDCYCGAGTFWALVICCGVGAFALGPAIYLPILARRRKRWYGGHCDVCSYDMSGTPNADRCPECGTGWKSAPKQDGT